MDGIGMEKTTLIQKIKKHGLIRSAIYQAWRSMSNPTFGFSAPKRRKIVSGLAEMFSLVGIKKLRVRVNSKPIYIDPSCPWALASFLMIPRYDIEEIEKVESCIPEDFIFIDVGANFGVWTFTLAKHFKNIIAIEPDFRCYECLTKTKKMTNESHIQIMHMGVSNFDGDGQLFAAPGHAGDGRIYDPADGRRQGGNTVEIRKLDSVLDSANLAGRHKYFIKMDVQGSEPQVLEGAMKTLSTASEVFLHTEIHPILNEAGSSIDEYINLIRKLGFEPVELRAGQVHASSWEEVNNYLKLGNKDFCFHKVNTTAAHH
jgi:FkbM family methyltransferase